MWLGGLMGLIVVLSITFAQPRIGATATIGILIAGQLAMGAVIDRSACSASHQIAPLVAAHRSGSPSSPRARRCRFSVSHGTKVWTALWAVYIIWGSTYLGDRVAVETIAADARGLDALHRRRGDHGRVVPARGGTMRVPRRALLSCVLIGCLLPGANAVLFYAERRRADRDSPR